MRRMFHVRIEGPDGQLRAIRHFYSERALGRFEGMNSDELFDVDEILVPENWRDRLLLWARRDSRREVPWVE